LERHAVALPVNEKACFRKAGGAQQAQRGGGFVFD
jgi:hypothetical protein